MRTRAKAEAISLVKEFDTRESQISAINSTDGGYQVQSVCSFTRASCASAEVRLHTLGRVLCCVATPIPHLCPHTILSHMTTDMPALFPPPSTTHACLRSPLAPQSSLARRVARAGQQYQDVEDDRKDTELRTQQRLSRITDRLNALKQAAAGLSDLEAQACDYRPDPLPCSPGHAG